MKFGPVLVEQSVGAILAHGVKYKTLHLSKGERIRLDHVEALKAAGFEKTTVARLEEGDIGEDAAASAIAHALAGRNVTIGDAGTGRVNIYAAADGLFMAEEAAIHRVNEVEGSITLATRPPMSMVPAGEMIATVKIIPFAVPQTSLIQVVHAATQVALSIRSYLPMRIGVISTLLPGFKLSVAEKTLNILADRIAMTRATIVADHHVQHEADDLARAIEILSRDCDMIIVFGASAITDRRDVIPAAVEAAGGRVIHFGMPVDPGNLLLIGELADGKPILGAPGCARSPKESGFDWVLQRLLCGVAVSSAEIRRMGVGGLLLEKLSRQQDHFARVPAGSVHL